MTTRISQDEIPRFCSSHACFPVFFILVLIQIIFAHTAKAAEVCELAAAEIVSVEGIVEYRKSKDNAWHQAEQNTQLCAGDQLRTRRHSRAAVRLMNESVVRLDQRTALTFPEVEEKKSFSFIDLLNGAIHVITRTPKPFKVRTSFVNALVEGTEFYVGVGENSTRLVVYEGRVTASNDYGSLAIVGHEAAVAYVDQPPQRETIVRPLDAVQWALYYPAIIGYHRNNNLSGEADTDNQLRQAEHLLSIGRVDEAHDVINQVLSSDADNSDAIALQAIIAVVQNNKEQALELATHAVELDPFSVPAKLALSYAQQAHFKIEEALNSVQQAVDLDLQNALLWARLAELQMSVGELRLALDAAQEAVNLNPAIAKTQTVLGFAYLLKINTAEAKSIFTKAIFLDQSDPMPRLGMGLALIREGDLEAGRIELEIAAILDPANSLIRSYLGKAYFEENRYPLASTQFDLARERDPNDPTPWLYDAIQKQTQNQPVEALKDIQKSIELNDNRAVYRSGLLLDQDEAARGTSLARIYDNLGFEKRALVEATKSLSIDPANHSAHRFLSDAYIKIPMHASARASELLQAQLLQPININPVQPPLVVDDFNVLTESGVSTTGFNEFTPLMERNKSQLIASSIVGSNNTFGDEIVASALYDRASISVGQYHFRTDGFRKNNDQKHNIYNAFMQYAVTPRFNVQTEIRRRKTEHGDLFLDFDTTNFRNIRRKLEQDTVRVGARYALSPRQDLIISAMYANRQEDISLTPVPGVGINPMSKDHGYQIEGQYFFHEEYFNFVAGGGAYRISAQNQIQICVDICLPSPVTRFNRERENTYIYSNFSYPKNITTTLGVSYDSFKDFVGFKFDTFNPKFGLQWNITDMFRLRLAWFETIKPALITNQTLEPTQVAGFNQLFDDSSGTRSRRVGIGLDAYFSENIYGGIELSERDLRVPFFDQAFVLLETEKQQERIYRSYLYWLPHVHWTVNGEFQFERYTRNAMVVGNPDEPFQVQTLSAPLSINYFHPSGISGKFTTTYVQQNLERLTTSTVRDGTDSFVLFDAAIGYRLPNRKGLLSLEVRNLLNEDFFYRNVNFQNNAQNINFQDNPLENPNSTSPTRAFVPERTFFMRFTWDF